MKVSDKNNKAYKCYQKEPKLQYLLIVFAQIEEGLSLKRYEPRDKKEFLDFHQDFNRLLF